MEGVGTAAGARYVVLAEVEPMPGQYRLHITVGHDGHVEELLRQDPGSEIAREGARKLLGHKMLGVRAALALARMKHLVPVKSLASVMHRAPRTTHRDPVKNPLDWVMLELVRLVPCALELRYHEPAFGVRAKFKRVPFT